MIACCVCVQMHHQEWCLDRKVVNKFRQFAACWICECAPRTRLTHSFHKGIHAWPVKPKSKTMKGPICIQITTHSIGVECNEEEILQLLWDQLQTCVRRHPAYWFLHDQHVILNRDEGLAQWSAIVMVDLCQGLVVNHRRVEHKLSQRASLDVIVVCLEPSVLRWKASANCTVD
jgi:hypothetical protein